MKTRNQPNAPFANASMDSKWIVLNSMIPPKVERMEQMLCLPRQC